MTTAVERLTRETAVDRLVRETAARRRRKPGPLVEPGEHPDITLGRALATVETVLEDEAEKWGHSTVVDKWS